MIDPKFFPLPLTMKFYILLLITLFASSSCEKVRTIIRKGGGKPTAPAAPAVASTPYTGPAVSEISENDFESFRQQTGKVIVIDFYADWCGPCKKLGPILDQVASSHQGQVLVGKVNVDKSPKISTSHGVKSIPDVRIFRDGKEVDRFVGLPPAAEVRRRIENHLKALPPVAPKPVEAEKPKPTTPMTQPMSKDWLPEGMKRR